MGKWPTTFELEAHVAGFVTSSEQCLRSWGEGIRGNTLAGESLTSCVTLAKSWHSFRSQMTYLLKRRLD